MTTVFQKADFRTRLTAVTIASCVFALTLSCILLALWQYVAARQDLETQNRRIAEVLASAASAPVIFRDRSGVGEIVAAAMQNAAAVSVLDRAGRSLGGQRRTGLAQLPPPPGRQSAATISWRGHAMRIVVPIVATGELVGWLDTTIEGESLAVLAARAAGVTAILLLIAATAATLATRRLQPLLMRPLQRLLLTIEKVTHSGDLSLRVPTSTDPEIARVLGAFNLMVGEVERREAALAKTMGELEAARDAAEAANGAKSQFLAAMSHELRTPLNAVIAYGEIVEEDLEAEESPHLEDVRVINASARHLLVLINQVLDLAKIEARQVSLDLHSFDLEALVREVEATLKPLAARNGNHLTVTMPPCLPPVVLDSTKLRQCLINLGANACKFTADGTVALRVERTVQPDCLRINVSDTGIGMSQDLIERLFVPFSQADASTTRKFGGTGLGLAITADFIRLMSGRIHVSSEVGQGSEFTLVLPRRLPLSSPISDDVFDRILTP